MKSTRKPRRTPKKQKGRPSIYHPDDHPALARKLTGEGKNKQEISEVLGIARSTLDDWRAQYPAFSVAFVLGAEDANDRVERSTFERATGYTHPEEKLLVVNGEVERHHVTAHYPPDVAAIKFWLTNRRKDRWSDKQKIEHGGTLTLEQLLSQASAPEPKAETEKLPE